MEGRLLGSCIHAVNRRSRNRANGKCHDSTPPPSYFPTWPSPFVYTSQFCFYITQFWSQFWFYNLCLLLSMCIYILLFQPFWPTLSTYLFHDYLSALWRSVALHQLFVLFYSVDRNLFMSIFGPVPLGLSWSVYYHMVIFLLVLFPMAPVDRIHNS